MASWKVPADSTKALAEYTQDFTKNTVDSLVVKNLLRRVDKWVKQGFKVYAFRPPTTNAMVALENRISGFDEGAFKESFETAGGQWISIPAIGYVSYNGSHLEKESALKLSYNLGKIIANEYN